MSKENKTIFIPTFIDPKKIDEWKKKQPKIATCPDCGIKDDLKKFLIDKKIKCPKCKSNLTRINYTQGYGMGVAMTSDDVMGQVLETSRHHPTNKFDAEKYEEAVEKFNKTDYNEIITGIKQKEE